MDEQTNIEPPTATTLAKYGFGHGVYPVQGGSCMTEPGEYSPVEDWLELLASQGGVCPICGQVPTPNLRTGKVRFVIDHEHVRGWKAMPPEQRRLYVRGLTCWYCNHAYLGRGITLDKAMGVVAYLRRYAERRPA